MISQPRRVRPKPQPAAQGAPIDPARVETVPANLRPALEPATHPVAEANVSGFATAASQAEDNRVTAARRSPARVPDATYRLQFNRHFSFSQAAEIADYLRALGISDVYASPLFRAGPESSHGYDICHFGQFSPSLGSAADFEALSRRLRRLGLGLLLDMVPNHMGADLSNNWWLDVLEKGQSSQFASWFDIDWQPLKSDLHNQVLIPVLEDHYGHVLEAGKLKLVLENGAFALAYYDRKFPVCPSSYPSLLSKILTSGTSSSESLDDLRQLLAQAPDLCSEPAGVETLKARLRGLQTASPQFRERVQSALVRFNGRRGDPCSFNDLDQLLRRQHYRLAYWRVGPEEINYRRFFDVTDLVSLRMESPEVFESTHCLLESLLRERHVTGLRIDHPDGLWNPKQYFERLQTFFAPQSVPGNADSPQDPLYIVAEKILTGDERLPADWPVAGTTGYDFLNQVNAVFVQRAHAAAFDALYGEFTGLEVNFDSASYAGKMKILKESLISEHQALTQRLKAIAVATRSGQDLAARQLHAALAEIIACFPVYRTYVTEETRQLRPVERDYILEAVQTARSRNPALDPAACDFIQRLLLLDFPPELSSSAVGRCRAWVMKFQQLTGPVMAKGLEDTAFYNFNRLVSLNEVGGNPGCFGAGIASFHEFNRAQAESFPHALLATATHDTKRGEDLRARLNVLSEIPREWRLAILRWSQINGPYKSAVDGHPAPHPNDEYLFYQTLVGAWAPDAETSEGLENLRSRVAGFMTKALKEAKAHTSWTSPNSAYEEATRHFVETVLASQPGNPFLADFIPFQRKIAFFGTFNSLSQLLLKLTSPGVPDFYQGTELWDFNLVDPDNRRPVDYARRRMLLSELQDAVEQAPALAPQSTAGQTAAPAGGVALTDLRPLISRLLENPETGALKLYLVWRTLHWRRLHAEVFKGGDYLPLDVEGARRDHVCAFARSGCGRQFITVVPRFVLTLTGGAERLPLGERTWEDTRLLIPESKPGDEYRDLFTGQRLALEADGLPIAQALHVFPVALLQRSPAPPSA